jgi:hypothetical protein
MLLVYTAKQRLVFREKKHANLQFFNLLLTATPDARLLETAFDRQLLQPRDADESEKELMRTDITRLLHCEGILVIAVIILALLSFCIRPTFFSFLLLN